MPKHDGHNAEIILVGKSGELVLQQRDDKPGITNPGMVSSFGGGVEEGESALEAAKRELKEETNLIIDESRFVLYGDYFKDKETHGEDWKVSYFVVQDVDYSDLEVYEGQGYVVVRSLEELNEMKPSVLFRKVAEDWFTGWRDFLFMPEPSREKIEEVKTEYIASINTHGLKKYHKPLLFCSVGRVSSGKSTTMRQIVEPFDCVEISKDVLRERFYDRGFNFRNVVGEVFGDVAKYFSKKEYNIYLDTNSSTDWRFTKSFVDENYQPIVFYFDASEDFILENSKSKKLMSFFKNSDHIMNSYYGNIESYEKTKVEYLSQFKPLRTINPVRFSEALLSDIIDEINSKFVK